MHPRWRAREIGLVIIRTRQRDAQVNYNRQGTCHGSDLVRQLPQCSGRTGPKDGFLLLGQALSHNTTAFRSQACRRAFSTRFGPRIMGVLAQFDQPVLTSGRKACVSAEISDRKPSSQILQRWSRHRP